MPARLCEGVEQNPRLSIEEIKNSGSHILQSTEELHAAVENGVLMEATRKLETCDASRGRPHRKPDTTITAYEVFVESRSKKRELSTVCSTQARTMGSARKGCRVSVLFLQEVRTIFRIEGD